MGTSLCSRLVLSAKIVTHLASHRSSVQRHQCTHATRADSTVRSCPSLRPNTSQDVILHSEWCVPRALGLKRRRLRQLRFDLLVKGTNRAEGQMKKKSFQPIIYDRISAGHEKRTPHRTDDRNDPGMITELAQPYKDGIGHCGIRERGTCALVSLALHCCTASIFRTAEVCRLQKTIILFRYFVRDPAISISLSKERKHAIAGYFFLRSTTPILISPSFSIPVEHHACAANEIKHWSRKCHRPNLS